MQKDTYLILTKKEKHICCHTELGGKDLINLEAMHRIKVNYLEVMIMSNTTRVNTLAEFSKKFSLYMHSTCHFLKIPFKNLGPKRNL